VSERCHTCDRADCPTRQYASVEESNEALTAWQHCREHRVDWRARCLAAERIAREALDLACPHNDEERARVAAMRAELESGGKP
jgi:hypothetical protein